MDKRLRFMADLIEPLRVAPGSSVRLSRDYDPGYTGKELNHDFLWRCQRALPGRGEIGIFNRSHYEEVLVVRIIRTCSLRSICPHRRGSTTSGPAATGRSTTGNA